MKKVNNNQYLTKPVQLNTENDELLNYGKYKTCTCYNYTEVNFKKSSYNVSRRSGQLNVVPHYLDHPELPNLNDNNINNILDQENPFRDLVENYFDDDNNQLENNIEFIPENHIQENNDNFEIHNGDIMHINNIQLDIFNQELYVLYTSFHNILDGNLDFPFLSLLDPTSIASTSQNNSPFPDLNQHEVDLINENSQECIQATKLFEDELKIDFGIHKISTKSPIYIVIDGSLFFDYITKGIFPKSRNTLHITKKQYDDMFVKSLRSFVFGFDEYRLAQMITFSSQNLWIAQVFPTSQSIITFLDVIYPESSKKFTVYSFAKGILSYDIRMFINVQDGSYSYNPFFRLVPDPTISPDLETDSLYIYNKEFEKQLKNYGNKITKLTESRRILSYLMPRTYLEHLTNILIVQLEQSINEKNLGYILYDFLKFINHDDSVALSGVIDNALDTMMFKLYVENVPVECFKLIVNFVPQENKFVIIKNILNQIKKEKTIELIKKNNRELEKISDYEKLIETAIKSSNYQLYLDEILNQTSLLHEIDLSTIININVDRLSFKEKHYLIKTLVSKMRTQLGYSVYLNLIEKSSKSRRTIINSFLFSLLQPIDRFELIKSLLKNKGTYAKNSVVKKFIQNLEKDLSKIQKYYN